MGATLIFRSRMLKNKLIFLFSIFFPCFFFMLKSGAAKAAPAVAVPTPLAEITNKRARGNPPKLHYKSASTYLMLSGIVSIQISGSLVRYSYKSVCFCSFFLLALVSLKVGQIFINLHADFSHELYNWHHCVLLPWPLLAAYPKKYSLPQIIVISSLRC